MKAKWIVRNTAQQGFRRAVYSRIARGWYKIDLYKFGADCGNFWSLVRSVDCTNERKARAVARDWCEQSKVADIPL